MDLLTLLLWTLPPLIGIATFVLLRTQPSSTAIPVALVTTVLIGLGCWLAGSVSDTAETIAVGACFAILAGAAAFGLTRSQLKARPALVTSAVSALLVGVSFALVLYLAPAAFFAVAALYWILSRILRLKHALTIAGTVLAGLLAATVAAFYTAVSFMH